MLKFHAALSSPLHYAHAFIAFSRYAFWGRKPLFLSLFNFVCLSCTPSPRFHEVSREVRPQRKRRRRGGDAVLCSCVYAVIETEKRRKM